MSDPHKGGLCPDGGSAGFMPVTPIGDGLFEIVCPRDGSWVVEDSDCVAVEYSDYPAPPTTPTEGTR